MTPGDEWEDLLHDTACFGSWITWTARSSKRTRAIARSKRHVEHVSGRLAASQALTRLTGTGSAESSFHFANCSAHIGTDSDGCPIWPHGIVGSISHTTGIAAAVVALNSDLRGLGIDLEPVRAKNYSLAERVIYPDDQVGMPDSVSLAEATTIIFSIKEAVYKCVFPRLRQYLDWTDCRVSINWSDGSFSARLSLGDCQKPTPLEIEGRYRVSSALVTSVCWWD